MVFVCNQSKTCFKKVRRKWLIIISTYKKNKLELKDYASELK